jgi:hypothetical protein
MSPQECERSNWDELIGRGETAILNECKGDGELVAGLVASELFRCCFLD